ncbi:MAG: hypothetical protein ACD_46C00314G0008 [uncultured bacterium]|nr:MAG: hypothetical protein ACD_46C00314G0008 [uncultured bacterium]
MPILFIPNALEIYQSNDDAIARQFYYSRFLWLLNPGDIIILPELPSDELLNYLADLKQINRDFFYIMTWDNKFLIHELKQIINTPADWSIQACFFNQTIINLAKKLNIIVSSNRLNLAKNGSLKKLNSKINFRYIAKKNNIPTPIGNVCRTKKMLFSSIISLLNITGSVMIKQEYNGGGRGNIGITLCSSTTFTGVIKSFVIQQKNEIKNIINYFWKKGQRFVVEVYYPNTGSFTSIFYIPPLHQKPTLLNYSEIRMESTWFGVQIPAHELSENERDILIKNSEKLAVIIQNKGYQGYICCDAIRTNDNQILFTEINVRPGAETHAHVLATQLFGTNYYQHVTILTRKGVKISSVKYALQQLEKRDLLLNSQRKFGVALLTVDEKYSKQMEYFIAAPSLADAYAIEEKMLHIKL